MGVARGGARRRATPRRDPGVAGAPRPDSGAGRGAVPEEGRIPDVSARPHAEGRRGARRAGERRDEHDDYKITGRALAFNPPAPPSGSDQLDRRCRFTLFACFPSAERTSLGSRLIVRLRLAAAAAFLTFLRAARLWLSVAMSKSLHSRRACTAGPGASRHTGRRSPPP